MFKDWVLALDFDGVVWDSVNECFESACVAYQNLHQVDCKKLEKPFRAGRWLVRCGGDFYVVLKMALENADRNWEHVTKAEFTALKEANSDQVKAFETEMYRVRADRQKKDPDGWAASQKPYQGFVDQLPELKEAFQEIVLTTTKDEASAALLLGTAGIKMSIWGREHGVHKGEQINDLCSRRQVSATRIVFIDDLLDNLEQVRPTGAHAFLASWGYNTPDEQRAASEAGYGVLQQESILAQLQEAF
jgi:phosphoglycolate phosphatase-like HAD superfamily hydrolase